MEILNWEILMEKLEALILTVNAFFNSFFYENIYSKYRSRSCNISSYTIRDEIIPASFFHLN